MSESLKNMDKYKTNKTKMLEEKCFSASIIAAFISRESRGDLRRLGMKYLDGDCVKIFALT